MKEELEYPLWEQHLEEDIQGIFDRRLGIDNWPEDTEIPDGLIDQAETAMGM